MKEREFIKKYIFLGTFKLLLLVCFTSQTLAEEQSIQERISASKPGEIIELQEGEYFEEIIIDKPIQLVGIKEINLIQDEARPAITILSDQVTIKNLNIKQMSNTKEIEAISIKSDYNTLENIEIQTNGYGIKLENANNNKISHISITGNQETKQHGIYIGKSHFNEIHDSSISHVLDGIYIEQSNGTKLYQNTAYHSRYGFHLMFTNNTIIEHNHSYENVSGMMIMGANDTVVKYNRLEKNQKNIQSLGLLLFDTENALITENEIVNNRIGFLIDGARRNKLTFNLVEDNYIGLQFQDANDNYLKNNAFIQNIVQGQARESSENTILHNYWGDHLGLDMTGDGISNLPYTVTPFFLQITKEFPPFQLLFQAPGMSFMEGLVYIPREEQLIDPSPLKENPMTSSGVSNNSQAIIYLICIFLLLISLIIIYFGGKVNEKN